MGCDYEALLIPLDGLLDPCLGRIVVELPTVLLDHLNPHDDEGLTVAIILDVDVVADDFHARPDQRLIELVVLLEPHLFVRVVWVRNDERGISQVFNVFKLLGHRDLLRGKLVGTWVIQ